MKPLLAIIFSIYMPAVAAAQDDLMIFRDGSEKSVKVIQVADKRVTYLPQGKNCDKGYR